jgi:hypothetical protein
MKSPISEEGEKGVGVGVANGLGVARGPKGEFPREQPANGIVSVVRRKSHINGLLFIRVPQCFIWILDLSN